MKNSIIHFSLSLLLFFVVSKINAQTTINVMRDTNNTSTVNFVTRWIDTGTPSIIANSQIYDDDTNIGIGTTAPADKLHVLGTARFGGASNYSRFTSNGDLALTGNADIRVNGNAYAFRYYNNGERNQGIFFDQTNGYYEFISNDSDQIFSINAYTGRTIIGKTVISAVRDTDYMLSVSGKIVAKAVIASSESWSSWPDYVFNDSYYLPALPEVKKFIRDNGHLPGVPNAADIKDKGVDLAKTNILLLKKVEELTLYVIDLQEQLDKLKQDIDEDKAIDSYNCQ